MSDRSESLDEDVMFDPEDGEPARGLGDLGDPTGDVDDESDAIADEYRDDDPTGVDRAPQDLGEVQPAEEAAMHLTDDPPFDESDGYIEE